MITKRIRQYILTGKGNSFGNAYAGREVPSFPFYLMIMVYVRVFTLISSGIDLIDIIVESIYAGIYLIIWISQIIHPLRMTRMYYLCPKDRAEREADIRGAYVFRSILHSIMIVFMCFDIYMLQKANIWSVIYILIAGVMFGFLSQVKAHKYLLNLYVIPALTIVPYLLFALPAGTPGKGDTIFLICAYAFLLIAVLPAYIKIMKTIDKEIKDAAKSEEDAA